MANMQLTAELRNVTGSHAVAKMRRKDMIPGNIYGQGKPNVHVAIAVREIEKALASGEPLLNLVVGNETKVVLVKEVQRDPIKGELQHLDFYEVSMDRPVETAVPLVLAGEGERESDGGVVNLVLRELSISCLPNQIPEFITVNVAHMKIGDNLLVSDLEVAEGIEVLNAPNEVVATVSAPSAQDTAETEPEAAPAEETAGE